MFVWVVACLRSVPRCVCVYIGRTEAEAEAESEAEVRLWPLRLRHRLLEYSDDEINREIFRTQA